MYSSLGCCYVVFVALISVAKGYFSFSAVGSVSYSGVSRCAFCFSSVWPSSGRKIAWITLRWRRRDISWFSLYSSLQREHSIQMVPPLVSSWRRSLSHLEHLLRDRLLVCIPQPVPRTFSTCCVWLSCDGELWLAAILAMAHMTRGLFGASFWLLQTVFITLSHCVFLYLWFCVGTVFCCVYTLLMCCLCLVLFGDELGEGMPKPASQSTQTPFFPFFRES